MSINEMNDASNTSVLQDWLVKIPIRMQSTLILSLRGPDTHSCVNIKAIVRWLRGLTFKPGNPDNVREFMGGEPPKIEEKGPAAKELEFCSQHFYSHLMHGLEVVAYKHPDEAIAAIALDRFESMCSLMHLPIELRMNFERRLSKREWPGGKQPDTFKEALTLLDGALGAWWSRQCE